MKETITVASMPTAPISFKYILNTSQGLTPVLTAQNEIEFRDATGTVQFGMRAPNMSDSAAPEAAFSNDVSYVLTRQDTTWKLVVTPAYSWPVDQFAELLAGAGLVTSARLVHDPASERGFLDAHLLAHLP